MQHTVLFLDLSYETGHACIHDNATKLAAAAYTGNFFQGGSSTNSVDDRQQREWGSGGGSPTVSGSTHFANE
jgi:hypothetical protein